MSFGFMKRMPTTIGTLTGSAVIFGSICSYAGPGGGGGFTPPTPPPYQRVGPVITVSVAENSTMNLGYKDIDQGQTAARTITITHIGSQTVYFQNGGLLKAGTNPNDFIVSGSTAPIYPGQTRTISVYFDPSITETRTATLTINTNNIDDSSIGPINLLGVGTSSTPVKVTPNNATFPETVIGDTASSTLMIENRSPQSAYFYSVNITGENTPAFSQSMVTSLLGSGESRSIPVAFSPYSSGEATATLSIQTSKGSATVPLSGSGVTALEVFPTALDFGHRAINETSLPMNITLYNKSNSSPLTISEIEQLGNSGADFNLDQSPITLAPGETRNLSVTVTPFDIGDTHSYLTLESDRGFEMVDLLVDGSNYLRLDPPVADFGLHLDSAPADSITINVENTSPESISIDEFSLDGSNSFTMTAPTPGTLAPGESTSLSINATSISNAQHQLHETAMSTIRNLRGDTNLRIQRNTGPSNVSFGEGTLIDPKWHSTNQKWYIIYPTELQEGQESTNFEVVHPGHDILISGDGFDVYSVDEYGNRSFITGINVKIEGRNVELGEFHLTPSLQGHFGQDATPDPPHCLYASAGVFRAKDGEKGQRGGSLFVNASDTIVYASDLNFSGGDGGYGATACPKYDVRPETAIPPVQGFLADDGGNGGNGGLGGCAQFNCQTFIWGDFQSITVNGGDGGDGGNGGDVFPQFNRNCGVSPGTGGNGGRGGDTGFVEISCSNMYGNTGAVIAYAGNGGYGGRGGTTTSGSSGLRCIGGNGGDGGNSNKSDILGFTPNPGSIFKGGDYGHGGNPGIFFICGLWDVYMRGQFGRDGIEGSTK